MDGVGAAADGDVVKVNYVSIDYYGVHMIMAMVYLKSKLASLNWILMAS